jgi:hypothetical protein
MGVGDGFVRTFDHLGRLEVSRVVHTLSGHLKREEVSLIIEAQRTRRE